MAIKHPDNEYGSMGSVPDAPRVDGTGAGPMNIRANPDEFGAQVGGAVQKLGETGESVASNFGGLIMETQANQAELGYIKASGDLKAKYSQYEGLQAEAMRPQYEADLQQVHDQYRQNLPLLAQKQFDANTIRSLGVQTSEYSGYAASQVKQANLTSNDAIAENAASRAGNLPAVTDPRQFGELNGTIVHSANAVADIKGWASQATGTDPETGKLTFGDSPQAQATKEQYDAYVGEKQSKLYLTAAKTIADNQGAAAAADWAKAHWDMMPDSAKVAMNQYIAPKVKNETISGNIVNENNRLDADYTKQLTSNVPDSPTAAIPQNPLDVIRKNEGYTGRVGKDSNGADVLNGINSKAFPTEYAEAKNILDTQGKAAADKYADNFYQKNIIDKYNISSLPAGTQAIVADGLVNHGGGEFGQSLVEAAKNGASPQELIDMRRAEYQRLATADPTQYGSSLKGWNARLDGLQSQQGITSAAYPNKKDFLESQKEGYVKNSVDAYLKQYPDDFYGSQIQEKRATSEINRKIAIEDGKLKSDRDSITSAIGGSLTKGQPVGTYAELRALPGMAPVLDKAMREQGGFFGTIDTMIDKASHRDLSQNSPNAYDTIMRTLQPHDSEHPNAIASNDHLAEGLGSTNPGKSITWKDYNDAKPLLDSDQSFKDTLSQHMQEITNANGNLDGKGQERAMQWYQQVMTAKKQNDAAGDKKLTDAQFIDKIGERDGPPAPTPPSRMQQLENWVSSAFKDKQQEAPHVKSIEDYNAIPKGQKYIDPDGNIRTRQ